MSAGGFGRDGILIPTLVAGIVIALLEGVVRKTPDGTFLVALTFWTGIVEGCIALAATGELAKGLWLIPIKRELFSVYPLLLLSALLFPLLGLKMDIYQWTHNPTAWLDVRFFVIRNTAVLLVTFWAARRLTVAVMRGSPNKNRWAVLFITLFIVSQSLVAFDWIMTLEYPWVSTLLGGYFFVESFLMGLCVAALILFFRMRSVAREKVVAPDFAAREKVVAPDFAAREKVVAPDSAAREEVIAPGDASHTLTETLRDTAKMTFAFCFMWAGFFFSQFLVIWYGNIPEEVGYLLKRVGEPPFESLSWAVLITVWVIPFLVLLNGRIKTVPVGVSAIAMIILGGLFVEKLVMVAPVVPVDPLALAVETLLMILLVPVYILGKERVVPSQVVPPNGPEETP